MWPIVIPVQSAGSGGRLWLSEASCHATSSRHFSSRLPISSTELKAAALILVSSLSVPHCLSLCRLTRVWGSNMLSHRCPVLGGHKCGGGSRGSLITSVSSVWSSTLPGAVKLRLKFCGSVVTFCAGIGGNLIWWWR